MRSTQTHTFPATGVVLENLPGALFKIKVEQAAAKPELVDQTVLCTIAGKMRMNWVRLLPGDRVSVDISNLDTSRGRITYKLR